MGVSSADGPEEILNGGATKSDVTQQQPVTHGAGSQTAVSDGVPGIYALRVPQQGFILDRQHRPQCGCHIAQTCCYALKESTTIRS